ncbi:hypothetical protein [Vannielia litorea]|uniref:hypothetical protein n=1 Tax=Vannielia litorea TaxID=1217970 RepID=UPI001BCFB78C|nr:hypothetical protein [Vannielia litorea]
MTEPKGHTAICILGMHRSGTSCLAGSLEARGLFLGEVNKFATFNRRGNKENSTCMQINNDLLALNGGAWDKPPEQMLWNADLRKRRDAHIAGFAACGRWGFKDPRTVFTFPFWREALPEMRLVGTFRHPHAVARSLLRRGPKLAPATPPLDLWRRYNLRLLDIVERHGVPLLCFDWPPATYARAVDAIAADLGLDGHSGDAPEFYDHSLRQSDQDDGTLGEVSPEDTRIYEWLMTHAIHLVA